jgi:CheY-like chemotaxis protein
VLIVEDERVARRALSALLAAYGFQTAAVESAEEALQILRCSQDQSAPRVAWWTSISQG